MKMKDITKEYPNEDLTIVWQPQKCIHSEKCWRGLPEVFRYGKKPWVDPNGAGTEKIMAQIDQCPSGALSYKLKNEIAGDVKGTDATEINLSKNGPLLIKGNLRVNMPDGSVKESKNMAMCRCGASSNKPFCDGSHTRINFQAD